MQSVLHTYHCILFCAMPIQVIKRRSSSHSADAPPQPNTAVEEEEEKKKKLGKQRSWEERIADFVEDQGILVNYENMEGLLVNLGIIGALMLTLTVVVVAAIDVEDYYYGDYRYAMISSSEFRHVVHHQLVKDDFNFTVVFPKSGNEDDTIEDLHEYFLDDTDTSHFGCDMLNGPWHDCNVHLRDMLLTADLTYEYFNMHILYAYCTRHRCDWLLSRQLNFHYGLAAAFLLLSILMSTMFYVVLMRSPIAEQVKKRNFDALKRFQFFALPFMWLVVPGLLLLLI